MTDGPFGGAVLTGGRSSRMGQDKALLAVDGVPMAVRVATALRASGAAPVVTIGGDEARLTALAEVVVADRYPGEGPLGGIVTALASSQQPIVVITACDMPWLESIHVTPLVDALRAAPDIDVAASTADGTLQPLHAAWRVGCLADVRRLFDSGERAPRRVISALRSITVELGSDRWSADLDTPEDHASSS